MVTLISSVLPCSLISLHLSHLDDGDDIGETSDRDNLGKKKRGPKKKKETKKKDKVKEGKMAKARKRKKIVCCWCVFSLLMLKCIF